MVSLSSDILNQVSNEGGISKKKTQAEINQETISQKLNKLADSNKYIEDTITKLKEQIAKGKEYKFIINRSEDGLIKELVAVSKRE